MNRKIIIYSTPIIISGNMEFIHYEFAKNLKEDGYEVIFWGLRQASERISSEFIIKDGNSSLLLIYCLKNKESIAFLFAPASLAVHGFKIACIGRLCGIKVIIRVTSKFIKMTKYSRNMFDYFKRFLKFRILSQVAVRLANIVIVPKYSKHEFVNGKKSEVIMFSRFEDNIDIYRERNKRSNNYLFIGNLVKEKNLNELIEIAKAGFRIDVLGTGYLADKLIHDNLTVHGRVDESEVRHFIEQTSGLILPSLIGGDFYPNVVIEALSMNTPVISRLHCEDYDELGVTVYQSTEELIQILKSRKFKTPNYNNRREEFKRDMRKNFAENIDL